PNAPRRPAPLPQAARDRVRRAVESVGLIFVRNAGDGPAPRPRGSGVIVRNDGILATNFHVISDTESKQVFDELYFALGDAAATGGRPQYRLETLVVNRQYDLALLRIRAGSAYAQARPFPALEVGDSQAVRLLDDLVIIGYPEKGGASVTLSTGVVEGRDTFGNWIKTDARVIHGNSGGAAVSRDGKLIGIPTKVEADDQAIDRDGDGFPDAVRTYGAVGFLRPAHLVAAMLARLDSTDSRRSFPSVAPAATTQAPVNVRGVVRSLTTGKPLAGALVGLLPLGSERVTEESLLAWGSANADGEFELNKQVPPGRYTVKAKALGHDAFSGEVEVKAGAGRLLIQLREATAK
ncbi:MAG TPA: trypsin-like peptidase domain-containing protein, partial [Blastocatellia bacterium]|nr:trypsin-like peptidase domain-containing protein [Blastocatellia bacterium]